MNLLLLWVPFHRQVNACTRLIPIVCLVVQGNERFSLLPTEEKALVSRLQWQLVSAVLYPSPTKMSKAERIALIDELAGQTLGAF